MPISLRCHDCGYWIISSSESIKLAERRMDSHVWDNPGHRVTRTVIDNELYELIVELKERGGGFPAKVL